MKRSLLTGLAIFAALFQSFAQKYAPHEQWPFIYEDFAPAELLTQNGDRILLDAANISVGDAKVYFFENDTLKVSTRVVVAAKIADDNYLYASGRLMKVLRRTEHGAVLFDKVINLEAMSRDDVGYGFKSSVSATEKRNIFEGSNGATISLRMVQQPLEVLKTRKNGGAELILKEYKYIWINGGYVVRAMKNEVRDLPWIDKKELDAFWKQNKVKYSNDDGLAALAEYLYSKSRN